MTCLNMSDSLKTPLFAKVETQDFASHKGVYAAIASGLVDGCIGIGWTGDARFCNAIGLSPLGMTDIIMDYIRCLQK